MPGFLREVLAAASDQGFNWEFTSGGHIKITPPDPSQRLVFTASTPSDKRGLKNLIRDLRHAGFEWRGR